jgi:hypothetical protein
MYAKLLAAISSSWVKLPSGREVECDVEYEEGGRTKEGSVMPYSGHVGVF